MLINVYNISKYQPLCVFHGINLNHENKVFQHFIETLPRRIHALNFYDPKQRFLKERCTEYKNHTFYIPPHKRKLKKYFRKALKNKNYWGHDIFDDLKLRILYDYKPKEKKSKIDIC